MPPVLNLTFDDGPDMFWTPRILEVLERCDARATFFMVGERVQHEPSLARAVLEAGHEIQLHCHHHARHPELTEAEIELDTRAALETLAEINVRPKYWRTPWGAHTPASVKVAARHSLTLVGWTIDTHDWRGDPPPVMLARARACAVAGAVVLMHDALGPGAIRKGCENTVGMLAPMISLARREGLDVAPLSREGATMAALGQFTSATRGLASMRG